MKRYEVKFKIKVELELETTEIFTESEIKVDYNSLQDLENILFGDENKKMIEEDIRNDLSWMGDFNKVEVIMSKKELKEI